MEHLRDLPAAQMLHFEEMLDLAYSRWIHGTPLSSKRRGKSLPGGADPVHLVLYHALSVSMGRKRPRANAHEPDLVLYHVFLLRRYADNKLHVWVFRGYLVLYHLPSLPPGLHVGIAPLEVTGVLFQTCLLGLFLPCLFTLGTAARFLPVLDPAIRRKVLPTEKAPLDHRIP